MGNTARLAAAAAILLSTISDASIAHAATSEDSAWWNDRPVAKAWFNSGGHRPDLGRNSFTLKVEDGASEAGLYWEFDGRGQHRIIRGSNNEITFSVSPAVRYSKPIWYQVCGKIEGRSYCGPGQSDRIR